METDAIGASILRSHSGNLRCILAFLAFEDEVMRSLGKGRLTVDRVTLRPICFEVSLPMMATNYNTR